MLKERSIFMCIVLSIVTFGIYSIFWIIGVANEIAEKNNEPAEGGKVILYSILTLGIYFLIWSYRMGEKIERAGGKNEGAVYLVLSLMGASIIALALMQCQENSIIRSDMNNSEDILLK